MNILFRLPIELMGETLSHLSPDELTYKFDLEGLIYDRTFNSYSKVRQMAFFVKYKGKHVTISNTNINDTLQLSNFQLQYLNITQMVIKPKVISLVLFDCNNRSSYNFISFMLSHHFKLLKSFTNKFSFQLSIHDDNLIDINLLNGILYHFSYNNYIVNWFSIHYKTVKQITGVQQTSFEENSHDLNHGSIENLELHLFNSSRLMEHFMYFRNHNCICGNLKTLDLSYNNINDENLAKLYFPDLIQDLNLSNNNLHTISNNFNINNLANLRNLNLSNNNLIRISISINISFNLEVLVLSGNNLNNCNFLCKPFFQNLLKLNISRNLISNLINLPTSLERLDLSGNYLSSFFNEQTSNVFPASLVELNLSWCKILFKARLNVIEAKRTLHIENLHKLKSLILSGNYYYNINSEILQLCK
ncbi:unnamed protein product [Debaryomyces fabryi]|nr:unnamed protein product [Debaryomyces fabryi]